MFFFVAAQNGADKPPVRIEVVGALGVDGRVLGKSQRIPGDALTFSRISNTDVKILETVYLFPHHTLPAPVFGPVFRQRTVGGVYRCAGFGRATEIGRIIHIPDQCFRIFFNIIRQFCEKIQACDLFHSIY